MKYINIMSLIVTCLGVLYVLYKAYRESDWKKNFPEIIFTVNKKTEYISFGILLLVAVGLRIYRLGEIPGPINQDSAMAAVNAYSLLLHGTDIDGVRLPMQFAAWGDQQMNVLMSYLMIPWIKVFGLNKIATVMPTLILNIAGMLATYGIVRLLFSNGIALLYLGTVTCNPWHFIQGRWPLESNIFPHIFAIALLLMLLAVEKKQKWLLYVGVVIMGLNHYSYGITLYVIPVFLLLLFIDFYKKKLINGIDFVVSVVLYMAVAWPFYSMIFINMFKLPTIELPFVTIPFFEIGNRQNDILLFSANPFKQFFMNLKSVWDLLIKQRDYLIWSTVPHFGTMMKCFVPIMLLGAIGLVYDARKKNTSLTKDKIKSVQTLGDSILLFWWIVAFIAGLMTNDTNSTRMNIALYPCLILVAFGIAILYIHHKKWVLLISFLLIGMYGIFMYNYFHIYPDKFYDASTAYAGNFTNALMKAHEVDEDRYVITPDAQYIGAYTISEVDTMFIWKIDSDYRLGKTNQCGVKTIPYAERFMYKRIESPEDLVGKAVYVIESDKTQYLNDSEYDFYYFGQFCTCIPKEL